MKNRIVAGVSLAAIMIAATAVVWSADPERTRAHCQVPCGIYDDHARIAQLKEDATTIRKAVTQIADLAGKRDAQSVNQATRWVVTKETHASHIIEVVSQYFLTQKLKPIAAGAAGYDSYLKKLADYHTVMVAAMKTKQTADLAVVGKLERAIDAMVAG